MPISPLLHQSIEHHSKVTPNHIAIDEGDRSISYLDLATAMQATASYLQTLGIEKSERIGLLNSNGIEACIAILGSLRAGACYVPLNTTFPGKRLEAIVKDAGIRIIISSKQHLAKLVDFSEKYSGVKLGSLIILDVSDEEIRSHNSFENLSSCFNKIAGGEILKKDFSPKSCSATENDLAYIMYTSGTTGNPKGVMISHNNVTSFLTWAIEYFSLTSQDRMSNHSDISFDLSVFDIFGAFYSGATLCPISQPGDFAFPANFIKDRKLTIWFSVPSVIGTLWKSGQLTEGAFTNHLRWAIFCGEALAPKYADAWITTHPKTPICNLYGPTEATIACTYHNVGIDSTFDPSQDVPIGFPIGNTEINVLNDDLKKITGKNSIGKLTISGPQLSQGYWKKEELTNKVFFSNEQSRFYDSGDLAYSDENNLIRFVGRKDTQVKIRGYRVELGDIENAIIGHSTVNEVAVLFFDTPSPLLIATVALQSEAMDRSNNAIEEDILDHCERLIPSYMIPRRIDFFTELPKNVNGKIDRNAIREILGKNLK
jgi:amino acid adenylation domain-containing protein